MEPLLITASFVVLVSLSPRLDGQAPANPAIQINAEILLGVAFLLSARTGNVLWKLNGATP